MGDVPKDTIIILQFLQHHQLYLARREKKLVVNLPKPPPKQKEQKSNEKVEEQSKEKIEEPSTKKRKRTKKGKEGRKAQKNPKPTCHLRT